MQFKKYRNLKRLKVRRDAKSWDKLLLGLFVIVFSITIVLGGLDTGRFDWSPHLPRSVHLSGIILTILGFSLFLAALRQNKFFSPIISFQTGENHAVCDTGVYKLVRHPGYLGLSISLIGIPLLTGSLWSMIPALIGIIILWIRTSLEDKTLKNELKGYLEYTKRTRYKLIPWVY